VKTSNLSQVTDKLYSNLSQVTDKLYSNLSQVTDKIYSNLSQVTDKLYNNLSQATDKLYHIMLYTSRFELTTLVVKGNDCTGSCKFNYHTIMTTTTPLKI
jgi:hypothetical protein